MSTSYSRMADTPDVVVVVLDCVRQDILTEALNDPLRMHFLRDLSSQVAQYTGAIAPGSWTIPSHASLFTGLYPWDHGAMYRTGLVLTPNHHTIAELLSSMGYATASFSGNGLVQPGTGLTRGFARSLWAGDREFYLRFVRPHIPSCRPLSLPGAEWYPAPSLSNESSILGSIGNLSSRSPALWDCINRVGARIRGGSASGVQFVARWIESELKQWIGTVPSSQPIFAFINLIEAHEPYLINGGEAITLQHWLRSLPMRNAQERWLAGRGRPSVQYLSEFRGSYTKMLNALDRRVRAIVDLLRESGRWRKTLFILTSDHGQSFWENGLLGHRLLVTDSLTRVPLWVRPPEGRLAGTKHGGWCSLIDVPATIALAASGEQFGDKQSINLLSYETRQDDRIVYSTADGITQYEARGMAPEKKAALDQIRIAAYRGEVKVVVERGKPTILEMPIGSSPRILGVDNGVDLGTQDIELAAEEKLERISLRQSSTTVVELSRRLAAWGY